LQEVEEATRIRLKYLSAFENGDYGELPPPVYARGLLRTYALFLGLDPQEALELYAQEAPPAQTAQRGPTFMAQPLSRRRRLDGELLASLVIFLAIVAALAWVVRDYVVPLVQEPDIFATPVEAPTGVTAGGTQTAPAAPTVRVPPTHTAVPAGAPTVAARQIELRITLIGGTTVQVRVDGQVAFEGPLSPGDSRTWVAQQAVALRAEDGSAVSVTVNGRDEGPLGGPGQAVNLVWVLGPDGKPVRLTVPGGGG
jgi:cytoskeletal protein RodZ